MGVSGVAALAGRGGKGKGIEGNMAGYKIDWSCVGLRLWALYLWLSDFSGIHQFSYVNSISK